MRKLTPKQESFCQKYVEIGCKSLAYRVSYNTIPPKVEYSLSGDGHEFRGAILPLLRWAAGRDGSILEPCMPGCKRHKVIS